MQYSIKTISLGTAVVATLAAYSGRFEFQWIGMAVIFLATAAFLACVEYENKSSRASYVFNWGIALLIVGLGIWLTISDLP